MNTSAAARMTAHLGYLGIEVAVIGMAGRFPGAADVDEFWRNLKQGRETLSRLSESELRDSGVPDELICDPRYVPVRGLIPEAESFDNDFFGYSPREARLLDPQIRVMHEIAWHALEDAGHAPLSGSRRIGLYAGASANPLWHMNALMSPHAAIAQFLADKDYLCTRIAHKLDLKGPAVFVQTACSTSLVAIHLACRGLLTGDCDLALAGGVSIKAPRKVGYLHQEGMICSSDGHCRVFDAQADGTVSAEAAGLVVLKSLSKALEDRDHIYAVVRSSAINNDGSEKASFSAPSLRSQVEVIRRAHRSARVDPSTIGLIEAHGTGTLVGDPIEVSALHGAFQSECEAQTALSAVKSNIGHSDQAAGIAGFIKAVQCVRTGQIPATLHFKEPNPELRLPGSSFFINDRLIDWPEGKDVPKRAAVTSLGIGGTNAHVLLEEAPDRNPPVEEAGDWHLVLTTAKSRAALDRLHNALSVYLQTSEKSLPVADIAFTLQTGRTQFEHRHAVLCRNLDDVTTAFTSDSDLSVRMGLGFAAVDKKRDRVAFLFAGQGSQYAGLGKGLYNGVPAVRRLLDDCFSVISELTGQHPRALLIDRGIAAPSIDDTRLTQPLIFSYQYALAHYLIRIGIAPSAMLGHSLGEYAAACIAGVMSLRDALRLVCARGELMQSLAPGHMLRVRLSEADVVALMGPNLSVAALNGPTSTVVSGDPASIKILSATLQARNVPRTLLRTSHAFHSALVEPIRCAFEAVLRTVTFHSPKIPYISNVTGTWITADAPLSPQYWLRHMREPVQFSAGLQTLLQQDALAIADIGPSTTLSRLVRGHRHLGAPDSIGFSRDGTDPQTDQFVLQRALGKAWLQGVELNWVAQAPAGACKVPLPGYPFDRKLYCFEALGGRGKAPAAATSMATEAAARSSPQTPDSVEPLDRAPVDAESIVVSLFADALGLDRVAPTEDFFELGGDSLSAMTVIERLHQALHARISLARFFEEATARSVARCLESSERSQYSKILRAPDRPCYTVSAAQRRLFIVHQTEQDNVGYNETLHMVIEGDLDVQRLQRVIAELVHRHEILRTSLTLDGTDVIQRVHPIVPFGIERYDADDTSLDLLLNNIVRPFVLDSAPLFRVALIRVSPTLHRLVMDFHHVVIDGTSMVVLYREMMQLYGGAPLDPVTIHYKDYAQWQAAEKQLAVIRSQEQFWMRVFAQPVPDLQLPTDYRRPVLRGFAGETLRFAISGPDLLRLRETLLNEGVSMFMMLLSCLYILLGHLSGNDDICVGTVVAGRRHASLMNMVGVFLNTLVLRARPVKTLPFNEFLASVKQMCLEAFENQEYPYETLIEKLNIRRDTSRNSMFDVMFVLQNMTGGRVEREAMGATRLSLAAHAKPISKFDLTLTAFETGEGLQFTLDYSTNLFTAQSATRFSELFLAISRSAALDPTCDLKHLGCPEDARQSQQTFLAELEGWTV